MKLTVCGALVLVRPALFRSKPAATRRPRGVAVTIVGVSPPGFSDWRRSRLLGGWPVILCFHPNSRKSVRFLQDSRALVSRKEDSV